MYEKPSSRKLLKFESHFIKTRGLEGSNIMHNANLLPLEKTIRWKF